MPTGAPSLRQIDRVFECLLMTVGKILAAGPNNNLCLRARTEEPQSSGDRENSCSRFTLTRFIPQRCRGIIAIGVGDISRQAVVQSMKQAAVAGIEQAHHHTFRHNLSAQLHPERRPGQRAAGVAGPYVAPGDRAVREADRRSARNGEPRI